MEVKAQGPKALSLFTRCYLFSSFKRGRIEPMAGLKYYGFCSDVNRGKRKKQDQDGMILSILEPDGSSKAPTSDGCLYVNADYPEAISA
jgi:hypothetical protein